MANRDSVQTIESQSSMTYATLVHILACFMVVPSSEIYARLVVSGGLLAMALSLCINHIATRVMQPIVPKTGMGLYHHLMIANAFLLGSSSPTIDLLEPAVALFDVAFLTVRFSRGSASLAHAIPFAGFGWCMGLIFYDCAGNRHKYAGF